MYEVLDSVWIGYDYGCYLLVGSSSAVIDT